MPKFDNSKLLYYVSADAENCIVPLCIRFFAIEAKKQLPNCNKTTPIPLTCYPILYKMREAAINTNGIALYKHLQTLCQTEDLNNGALLYNIILFIKEWTA